MAGFRPAQFGQASVKMSMFGPPGSGKSFTALLFAEGLAEVTGKKIAVADTEHGTDFYSVAADRTYHPQAFVFDALYTRSLTEVTHEVKQLDPKEYGVVVIDTVTHFWEAAQNAYRGKLNRVGRPPIWAWSELKRPYKELIKFLMDSPFHAFILGRQGLAYGDDGETGESRATGFKMRAEGETQYEPHICLRMESVAKEEKGRRGGKVMISVPTAFAEKDRSGVLQGYAIEYPCFENVIKPILKLMNSPAQVQTQTEEDAALQDSEAMRRIESEKIRGSQLLKDRFTARFLNAETVAALEHVGKDITTEVKLQMSNTDLGFLKAKYFECRNNLLTRLPERPSLAEPELQQEAIESEDVD